MINTNFIQNTIQGHLVEISNIPKIEFYNIRCAFTNPEINIDEKLKLGGCFRTKNIVSRKFEKVFVEDSFSGKTTVGIKIIDTKDEIEKMMKDISINLDMEVLKYL